MEADMEAQKCREIVVSHLAWIKCGFGRNNMALLEANLE